MNIGGKNGAATLEDCGREVVQDERGKIGRGRIIVGIPVVIAVFIGFTAFGGWMLHFLYVRVGTPPPIIGNVIAGFVGFSFLMSSFALIGVMQHKRARARFGFSAHTSMLDALNQIAHGNFDILLPADMGGPYQHIANAINDMARNLGDLENMRQDFISNVSHEIQSPLTSIGGFAALLQRDGVSDEDRRHYAAIIESESKRLSSLSDNLLKLSSLESEKKPLSLAEFRLDKQLERIALSTEPLWSGKGLALEAELPRCVIRGDEALISQVWTNLLYNAVKFTPVGGIVCVELEVRDSGVAVVISDTGCGIAPEDQIHIFERFYKVDKSRDRSLGGNGLGLALVKRIVELHGGSVTVRSRVGEGAAFEVVLPRLHSV